MRMLVSTVAGTALLMVAAWHLVGGADAMPRGLAGLATGEFDPAPVLAFEPNRGQAAPGVRFVSRGDGFALLLSDAGAVLRRPAGDVGITLAGARRPAASGADRLPGASHYFTGDDPGHWLHAVPRYRQAEFAGVHDGIDLSWRGHEGRVELGFTLAPGASPDLIAFDVEGAGLALDDDGDLRLAGEAGLLVLERPLAYQVVEGRQEAVDSRYRIVDADTAALSFGRYDAGRPLVVVPVLAHRTSPADAGPWPGLVVALEADAGVALWSVGSAMSANGDADAYACRIDAANAGPECAYFGGMGEDAALALAMGPDGGVHVAGTTRSGDFPMVAAHQARSGGASDAFVLSIDAAFERLAFSTYLGGAGDEAARGVAIDAAGVAYVTGDTSSRAFPTTAGTLQGTNPPGDDAFVAKFDTDGTLAFATYLGGSAADSGRRITLDEDGHVYVSGHTASADFPSLFPVIDATAGGQGAFLARLHRDGGSLLDGTFLVAAVPPRVD
ncbi:MAG TPA: SBBP repeat-containing protein [Pilimelia sp.]|nr:SBBP repeat-containing protein [Xanthomonadaceae bacterium]HEX5741110.1 SBBP repeat-containing protein [Pilimelia sp.]